VTLKSVEDLVVAGRRVFVRVDFNVPRDSEKKIIDDRRIREALPTIRHLMEHKARIILASHLGRPKGEKKPDESLIGVAERLAELLDCKVIFPEDCIGDAVRKLTHDLREGEVLLLENLRFHPEEEANDPSFSKALAQLADVYVTDAFGTLHRAHASTAGMVRHFREKGIGLLVKKELEFLSRLLEKPAKPFLAVLGGAKVSDKISLIENLLPRLDGLLIGGAIAYTFLKALGQPIGASRLEEEKLYVAHKILDKAKNAGIPIYLPTDHRVADRISPEAESRVVKTISEGEIGLEIGPETTARYEGLLREAKTIFWNGPMGMFEFPAFAEGTKAIARAVAQASDKGAVSVVGGGESLAAIDQSGVADKITHLSTGGGATLEFLGGKELPGLKALET